MNKVLFGVATGFVMCLTGMATERITFALVDPVFQKAHKAMGTEVESDEEEEE